MAAQSDEGDWDWVFEAAGALGWTIPEVLNATLPEINLALSGLAQSKGVKTSGKGKRGELKKDELAEMMALYPDRPGPVVPK